jgi:hypothetical protein
LRCATSEAARFLGESDRAGTIAEGKRADLVVLRSDPLRDVGALRDIEAVCVNGYYLLRVQLQKLLDQRAALAAAPPRLPSAALQDSQGSWTERIVGSEAGRLTYRHSRIPDGGWLIEERHAAAVPRRHLERRSARLVLDAQFNLRTCSYSVESFAGAERGEITYSTGRYAIEATDVDGSQTRGTLDADPMLPSERLTLTLWPLVFSNGFSGTTQALDVEAGVLAVREMSLADGRLSITRPTHATEQAYRLAPDGRFLGMQEMMPLLWLRELAPASHELE